MADMTISSQTAVGRVTFLQLEGYNLLAWLGTDDQHSLNISTSADLDFPSSSTGQAGSAQSSLCGTSVVVMPDGVNGYVGWVNGSDKISIAKISAGTPEDGAAPQWSLGTVVSIQAAQPASPPTIGLGTQNGHLVLNVIWQDGGLGCLAVAQLLVGDEAATTAYRPLGKPVSSTGMPSLATSRWGSYLAWPSQDAGGGYLLNLVQDPEGGINFDFDRQLIHAVACQTGVAYVPLGTDAGYGVYSDSAGVHYVQIARSAKGGWVVNPSTAAGMSGTIGGSVPQAPVNGSGVRFKRAGTGGALVSLVWPADIAGQPSGSIAISAFQPVFAPVPVVAFATA